MKNENLNKELGLSNLKAIARAAMDAESALDIDISERLEKMNGKAVCLTDVPECVMVEIARSRQALVRLAQKCLRLTEPLGNTPSESPSKTEGHTDQPPASSSSSHNC